MAISSAGIGSGLDINGIISQLMQIESQPLYRLQNKVTSYESEISALGQLKSALSSFKGSVAALGASTDFQTFAATSSDDTIISATSSSSATAGTYSVNIVQRAQAHKLSSNLAAPVADSATSIGSAGGNLTLSLASGSSFTVAITAGNDSLGEIATAINSAADNVGVTASVINVDDGFGGTEAKLILTADNTGTDNAISLSDTTGDVAATLGMATIVGKDARDAIINVDGFQATRSSNTITDVITGVTLNLNSDDTTAQTISVSRDVPALQEKVQSLVDTYNNLQNVMDRLTADGKELQGSSLIRGINNQLNGILNTPMTGVANAYTYLAEIGISRDRYGKLQLNSSDFEAAVNTDVGAVTELFTNATDGFATRLESYTNELSQVGGIIDSRIDGINESIGTLEFRIDSVQARLDSKEQRLIQQFSALDSLMAQMQGTSSYLSAQLAGLL